jgi:hypothetical protein
MAMDWGVAEQAARPLRPVARWEQQPDAEGRGRLVMVWAVPDPDTALTGLAVAEA